MAQWDDVKYAFLANILRNVDFLLHDPNETLDEDKIKRIYAEDLLAYGAFGSAVRSVTASGNVTLLDTDPVFIEIDPNGSNRDITFPAKGDNNHGYFVHHTGSANILTLKRSGGAMITTLAAGEIKYIKPSTANDFSALVSGGTNPSLLPNGGFRIAQRGAGPFTSTGLFPNNDDSYLIDGAILLSDGNDIVDVSQVADTDFVSGYKIRLDVETANKKFGILFPVENKDIQDVRKSGKASVQFKVKCTGTSMGNVRAYLVSWGSTADTITSDVISAWGAAGADPTFAANWTAENVGSNLPVTTTIALKMIEDISVDTAGVTNLAVLIIVDDTDASVGDFLEIGDVKLEEGTVCTDYVNPPFTEEVIRCRRLYTKSYDLTVVPGTASQGGYALFLAVNASQAFMTNVLNVTMRATPAVSVWSFAGTAGKFSTAAGSDAGTGTCSVSAWNADRLTGGGDSGSGFTAGVMYLFHYSASAEL